MTAITPQDVLLAQYLREGMTQLEAVRKAGFKCGNKQYAYTIVTQRKANPEFVKLMEEGSTPPSTLLDDRNKIIQAYSKLFDLCTNTKIVDKSGKPILYNPGNARQVLRDVAEILRMFGGEVGSEDRGMSLDQLTRLLATLEALAIDVEDQPIDVENQSPLLIEGKIEGKIDDGK